MKAIFLDRDDTIIIDVPYLGDPRKLKYFTWTEKALRIMVEKGFTLFLITNQSGIGRGYFSENDMHNVHQKIQDDLQNWNLPPFKEIVFCPHAPEDNCDCRKPNPKMIMDMIDKYSIDKSQSFMVGDKNSDVEAGKNAGIQSIFISDKIHDKYPTFSNILEFAKSL